MTKATKPESTNPMTPGMSVYLDIVRFCAAVSVFAFHLSRPPSSFGVIPQDALHYAAQMAVTIFFVLSGFVIAYIVEQSENTFPAFVRGRTSRLYSVLLPALFVTLLFDFVGRSVNPGFYGFPLTFSPPTFAGYLSSLFFVNEYSIFGFHTPGTDRPLWSLSFEATYYAIAGVFLFAPRKWSIPFAIVVLACAGRTVAAMFPLWIGGFLLYRWLKNFRMDFVLAAGLFLVSLLLILYVPLIGNSISQDNFGLFFPFGVSYSNRDLVEDYLTAACFAVNLTAARSLFAGQSSDRGSGRTIARWFGELTFPLYCLHRPTMALLGAVSPFAPTGVANVVFVVASVFLFVILLMPMTSALRGVLRQSFAAVRPELTGAA
jgi:peptidoglycan/LPS O-acetylase OafA/YrhL